MEWPDLVGTDVDAAVQRIKGEQPTLNVVKIADGSMVTADYREDRVRVFYTPAFKVSSTPRTG
jgi:hypothetical protein